VNAPTCALAADAAAVILAMLVTADHAALTPAEPGARSSVERGEAAPLAPRALWIGAAGFVDAGILPSAAPGAAATAAWRSGRLGLHTMLGATSSAEATGRTTVDGRTLGADVSSWFTAARAEILFGDRLTASVRAGFDLGLLHATGTGAWNPSTNTAFWMAAAAGGALRWRLQDRIALHAALDAVAPLVRPTLVIDRDVVHRPAPLAARTVLGAELGF
jgi:hypothetical protein